jgi:carbamate kinase
MTNAARTAVIALGGNALAPAGEKSTIYDQFRHARESLGPIVDLASEGWNVCVVHGNGPQVGDELVRNEVARAEASPLPLGVLVAATAGWIGYMIQQSIENALRRAGSTREAVTLITQVQVRADDPALLEPTNFIGQALSAERADELRREGHVVKLDGRGNARRVVGSPVPQAIHELKVIKRLVERGTLVIACGGGGAPIYDDPVKGWEGIDAVIDKDLAAAVLARDLGARLLLILTDVDAVYADWGTPDQHAIRNATPEQLAASEFAAGSMAPKVRAACLFAERTGGFAAIGSIADTQALLRGDAGTRVAPDPATVRTG